MFKICFKGLYCPIYITFNSIRVISSKVIIDRKKKLTMRKVHKEDFTTVLALITITVTSSSDKHYKEPMFLHLSLSIFIIYQFIYTKFTLKIFFYIHPMLVNF